MKKFILLLILLGPAAAFAQQYSIDWYKIAGGGGTSSNGQYSISGTIGQHDASTAMTGGSFSLTGGFWSLISVVQMAGSPILSITHEDGSVTVSWPTSATGFTLQQTPQLAAPDWVTSGYTVSTNGATNSITISAPVGNLFFRLIQP